MAESLRDLARMPRATTLRHCRRHDHRASAGPSICTVIGSGAVFLDGTIVNAALKHIGQDLPASIVGVLEGQAYIVGGYLAVLAALLILAGALSDHYGRRRVYAIGLVGFAATSALCGLAPTLEWLVVFRLAQGAAGALLIPGSLALITHAFDGAERGRAFGIWAAVDLRADDPRPDRRRHRSSTRVGWRVAFLINVPLLALRAVGDAHPRRRSRATPSRPGGSTGSARSSRRWPSAAWRSGSSAARRTSGRTRRPGSRSAIGVVALVAFPILMARRPHPLVPLELFRSRAFASINLATFFIYGGLYVTFFYQAVILQGVLGYTALGAGRRRAPDRASCWRVLSTRIGTLAGRIGVAPLPRRRAAADGDRPALVLAPAGRFGAVAGVARRPGQPHPAGRRRSSTSCPYALLFGLGISCVVAPLTSTLMGSISGRFSGLGSAINNSISRVGQPLLGRAHLHRRSARRSTRRSASATGLDTTDRRDPDGVPAAQPAGRRAPPRPRSPPRTRRRSTPSTWRCSSAPACSSSGRWCRGTACASRRRRAARRPPRRPAGRDADRPPARG